MTSKVQAEPNQCDLAPETPTDAFRKDKVFHVFQPLFYFSQLLQDIFLAQPRLTELAEDGLQNKDVFFHWHFERHPTLYLYFILTGTLAPTTRLVLRGTLTDEVRFRLSLVFTHHRPQRSATDFHRPQQCKPDHFWKKQSFKDQKLILVSKTLPEMHRNELFQCKCLVSTLVMVSIPTKKLNVRSVLVSQLLDNQVVIDVISLQAHMEIHRVPNATEAVPLEAYRIHSALSRSFWQDGVWVARKCNIMQCTSFTSLVKWHDIGMDRC